MRMWLLVLAALVCVGGCGTVDEARVLAPDDVVRLACDSADDAQLVAYLTGIVSDRDSGVSHADERAMVMTACEAAGSDDAVTACQECFGALVDYAYGN